MGMEHSSHPSRGRSTVPRCPKIHRRPHGRRPLQSGEPGWRNLPALERIYAHSGKDRLATRRPSQKARVNVSRDLPCTAKHITSCALYSAGSNQGPERCHSSIEGAMSPAAISEAKTVSAAPRIQNGAKVQGKYVCRIHDAWGRMEHDALRLCRQRRNAV